MIDLGTCRPGTTLYIPFDTFAAATGAPTALSNFVAADILCFKDGSVTERASTTGYTATTSFDSITGINLAIIDLSSDATGDFFKCGSRYFVVISPVTADGQTLAFVAATFDIGYPDAILNTSIATLASQTSFTLTSGPAEDDALNGMWCLVHDKASAVQLSWAIVLDYTGSTKTVTLAASPALTFTAAAIDNISFFAPMPLQSAVIGRTIGVETTGKVNVLLADTVTTYTGNTPQTGDVYPKVDTEIADIQARLPAALTAGGNMKSDALAINAVATTPVTTIKAVQGLATDGVVPTVTNLTNAPTAGDLTATMKASVKTQVTDGLNVDTYAEPGQEAPPATTTLVKKLGYLYKFLRNRKTQTATILSVYADDATTVDQKSTVSDNGTSLDSGEIGSGP